MNAASPVWKMASACGSWNVVTVGGVTPLVIRLRMKVTALTAAGESRVAVVYVLLVAAPPADARYSMKLQVRPSYESPCQTKPYLTSPAFCSWAASLSSCSQVVGGDRCSLASRSLR